MTANRRFPSSPTTPLPQIFMENGGTLSRVPPQSDVGVDVTELSPQSESTDVQTEAENAAYLPYSPIPNLATNVPVRQNSAYLPYSPIPYADIPYLARNASERQNVALTQLSVAANQKSLRSRIHLWLCWILLIILLTGTVLVTFWLLAS